MTAAMCSDRKQRDGTTARGCGQPILWAVTEKGRRMPLDPDPRADGNVEVVEWRGDTPLVKIHRGPAVPSLLDPTPERWMPHHATCPFAAEHHPRRKP